MTRLSNLLAASALLLTATFAVTLATAPVARAADEPAAATEKYVPTVLITGANRGIGLEYVREYAARGWNVIGTARKPAEATELNELAKANPRVTVEQLDVSDLASIDALAGRWKGKPVDILVNNAGITGTPMDQMFGKMKYEVFDQVFRTNVVGPMKMAEAFLPNLEASQQKKLVNVSSSEGSIGSVTMGRTFFYRASKAALNMEMKNLAVVLKNRKIAVAMINPGPVDTDMMKGMPKSMLRTKESAVSDMIRITDRLNLDNTGLFWNYSGEFLPW
ncbi:MAG: SDR family oxidoreductase [Gammaproteobacteria bacterium]|nr:SDR family oxidoreductase [Gammaproteobacteria bacterium]